MTAVSKKFRPLSADEMQEDTFAFELCDLLFQRLGGCAKIFCFCVQEFIPFCAEKQKIFKKGEKIFKKSKQMFAFFKTMCYNLSNR